MFPLVAGFDPTLRDKAAEWPADGRHGRWHNAHQCGLQAGAASAEHPWLTALLQTQTPLYANETNAPLHFRLWEAPPRGEASRRLRIGFGTLCDPAAGSGDVRSQSKCVSLGQAFSSTDADGHLDNRLPAPRPVESALQSCLMP